MSTTAFRLKPQIPRAVSLGSLMFAIFIGAYYVNHQSEDLLNLSLLGLFTTSLMVMGIRRLVGRRMSVSVVFAFMWVGYFSVRMCVIQLRPHDDNLYPLLRNAPRAELIWTWIAIIGSLAMFMTGVAFSRPWRASRLVIPRISDRLIFSYGTGALAVRMVVGLGHIHSGLAEHVSDSYLVMLCAMSARSIQDPRLARRAKTMLAFAALAGYLSGFKEQAVIPFLCYFVGTVAGGRKVRPKSAFIAVMVGITVFVSIQGARVAGDLGDPSFPPPDPITVLTKYNLESGLRQKTDRSVSDALIDTGRALSRRFGGADALVLLHRKAGIREPFQKGKTIWQCAISILPGIASFIHLDFPLLSLGHWFSDHYVTERPGEDPSSQAITMPGDLYLNYGTIGLILGMLLLGLMYGAIDRMFPPNTPLMAGFAFYVCYPLIGLERNLAYPLVGTAIRVGVILFFLGRMKRMSAMPKNPLSKGSRNPLLVQV